MKIKGRTHNREIDKDTAFILQPIDKIASACLWPGMGTCGQGAAILAIRRGHAALERKNVDRKRISLVNDEIGIGNFIHFSRTNDREIHREIRA